MAGTVRAVTRSPVARLDKTARTWHDQALAALEQLEECARSAPESAPAICEAIAGLLVIHTDLLDALAAPTAERPMPLADYVKIAHTGRRELRRELADHGSAADLSTDLRNAIAQIWDRLSEPNPPVAVRERRTAVALTDLLRLATAQWVFAQLDLPTAQGGADRPTRAALADTVRLLCHVLAERNPGRSVEVRVPPFAAVQIGAASDPGSVHTRGTPPNVVETDGVAFLRLATGRVPFDELRSTGSLLASGAHADISAMFPLL